MRSMRSLFVFTCLIIIGALIWAGIYARTQGFTSSWRTAIERDLESRGYYANVGKLTLGAFRGLVAEDVVLFTDAEREQVLAEVSDVYVDVGLRKILSKNLTINTLEIQDGRLSVPLEDGETVLLKNLSARLALTENLIEVVRLNANLSGLKISVKGALFRTLNERSKGLDSAEAINNVTQQTTPKKLVKQLNHVLERLQFESFNRPEIQVYFKGNIRELSKTQVIATLTGSEILDQSGYLIKDLNVKAEFDGLNGRGEITNFELRDEIGSLSANAKWTKNSREIDFKVNSSADIKTILSFLFPNKRWEEIVFHTQSTRFKADGTIDLSLIGKQTDKINTPYFPGRVIGKFQTGRFGITSGAVFNSIRVDFSFDKELFYLRNVRADHKTGAAFLNCKFQPGNGRESFKFQTEVKMDPRIFAPFLQEEDTKRFLKKWQFKESSGVYIRAAGQSTDLNFSDIQGRGVVALKDFELNNVPFQALETNVKIDGQKRWYNDVKFTREDGTIEAKLVYTDTENRYWEIDAGKSSINIAEGVGTFSPTLQQWLSPYQFSKPPRLQVNGKIDSRPPTMLGNEERNTDLQIQFESSGSVGYPLLGQSIPVAQPKGVLSIKKNLVQLHSASGKLAGGDLKLKVSTAILEPDDKSFKTDLKATRFDFNQLIRLYGLDDLFRGTVDGSLTISGDNRQIETFNGSGKLSIDPNDLLKLPPFKDLERLVKRDGVAIGNKKVEPDFVLKNGVLTIDKLVIPGSFAGSLELHLPKDRATITLLPKWRSGYQYQGIGSILNPRWETVPVKKQKPTEKSLAAEAELD